MSLLTKLVRLAASRVDIRPHVLPLLKKAADQRDLLRPLDAFVAEMAKVPGVTNAVIDDWSVDDYDAALASLQADVSVLVYVDPKVGGRATNRIKAVASKVMARLNKEWDDATDRTGRVTIIRDVDVWSPRRDFGGPSTVPTRTNPYGLGWQRGEGREEELARQLLEFYKRNPYTLRVTFSTGKLAPRSVWDDEAWDAAGGRSVGPYAHQASAQKVALSSVAKIIVDQMGGIGRLSFMLGIGTGPGYQFYDVPQGVGFVWPNKQRSKGNCIEVKLDPSDTYTVTFYNVAGADKKKVKEFSDIYVDQLVSIFEEQTGWRLRLGSAAPSGRR